MNVLIIGKDESLMEDKPSSSDTRQRHINYLKTLNLEQPLSSLKIITYSRRPLGRLSFEEGRFEIIPLFTRCRVLFLPFVLICIYREIQRGWMPDIITTQTPYEEGIAGIIAKTYYKIPFHMQLHFDVFSEKWSSEGRLHSLYQRISFHVLKRADRIRVVSEEIRLKLINQLGITDDRIDVAPVPMRFITPNTDPVTEWYRRLRKESSDHRLIIFVGRIVEAKNLKLWIDVSEQIAKTCEDALFVWIGDGESREIMGRYIGEKGLSNRYRLTGFVPYSELASYVALADVFLLTSYHEGFGRVIVEAQMVNVPVVSSNVAGPKTIIDSGETGILVDGFEPEPYAKAVLSLLLNDTLRKKMSDKAYEKAICQYSPAAMEENIVQSWINTISTGGER